MTTSTTAFGPEFMKELIDATEKAVVDSMAKFAHMAWSALLSFLAAHWLAVMALIFAIFVIVTLKAMLGRWGSLGSFLYNLLYFGILFIIGLIFGPEVFLEDAFKAACAVILYPVCYGVTGYILDKMGVKRWT